MTEEINIVQDFNIVQDDKNIVEIFDDNGDDKNIDEVAVCKNIFYLNDIMYSRNYFFNNIHQILCKDDDKPHSTSTFTSSTYLREINFSSLPVYYQLLLISLKIVDKGVESLGPNKRDDDKYNITTTISHRLGFEQVPRPEEGVNKRIIVNILTTDNIYSHKLVKKNGSSKKVSAGGISRKEVIQFMKPMEIDLTEERNYFFKSKDEIVRPANYLRCTVVIDFL